MGKALGRAGKETKTNAKRGRSAARGTNINATKRAKRVIEYEGHRIENHWRPHTTITNVPKIDIFFDDIEGKLLEVIEKYGRQSVVVGCVAWLSNPRIVRALAKCHYVLLLVNDENYARWGSGVCPRLYAELPVRARSPAEIFGHYETPLRFLPDSQYDPVWALGASHGNALMHSKYLVFFAKDEKSHRYDPLAVWTGSFNFTKHATHNQENAQFIRCKTAATAYFYDFANSFMYAQPIRTVDHSGNDDRVQPNQLKGVAETLARMGGM